MKKLIRVAMFFYRILGFQWVVSEVESFVLRYKLRVRMVPVSYKLFVFSLGLVVGGSVMFVRYSYPLVVGENKIVVENIRIETVQAKAPEVEEEKSSDWTETEVTAYAASVEETDASPLIMASGKMVYLGAVACPRNIDLGEKIEIKGLGVYTCEDRMNIRYTNNFDIFMLTKAEALKFGRQKMKYKIIK